MSTYGEQNKDAVNKSKSLQDVKRRNPQLPHRVVLCQK